MVGHAYSGHEIKKMNSTEAAFGGFLSLRCAVLLAFGIGIFPVSP